MSDSREWTHMGSYKDANVSVEALGDVPVKSARSAFDEHTAFVLNSIKEKINKLHRIMSLVVGIECIQNTCWRYLQTELAWFSSISKCVRTIREALKKEEDRSEFDSATKNIKHGKKIRLMNQWEEYSIKSAIISKQIMGSWLLLLRKTMMIHRFWRRNRSSCALF